MDHHWIQMLTYLYLTGSVLLGGPVAVVLLLSLLQFPEIILDKESGIKLAHCYFIICENTKKTNY